MLWVSLLVGSLNAACLPLKGSTACPSFQQYSVYQGSATEALYFPTVLNFDTFIKQRLLDPSPQIFNTDQSCNLTNPIQIPYLQSLLCATLVDISQRTYKCKAGIPITGALPTTLCKSSATSAANTISSIIANPAQCVSTANRDTSIYRNAIIFANSIASSASDCIISQSMDGPVTNGTFTANGNKSAKTNSGATFRDDWCLSLIMICLTLKYL